MKNFQLFFPNKNKFSFFSLRKIQLKGKNNIYFFHVVTESSKNFIENKENGIQWKFLSRNENEEDKNFEKNLNKKCVIQFQIIYIFLYLILCYISLFLICVFEKMLLNCQKNFKKVKKCFFSFFDLKIKQTKTKQKFNQHNFCFITSL